MTKDMLIAGLQVAWYRGGVPRSGTMVKAALENDHDTCIVTVVDAPFKRFGQWHVNVTYSAGKFAVPTRQLICDATQYEVARKAQRDAMTAKYNAYMAERDANLWKWSSLMERCAANDIDLGDELRSAMETSSDGIWITAEQLEALLAQAVAK